MTGPSDITPASDDLMNGDTDRPIKLDWSKLVEAGRPTRFGASWIGCRCGAKTRAGLPCKRPASKGRVRCRLHGGASTGPRTMEGRARIASANTTHGLRTKAKLAESREKAQWHRRINLTLRMQIEMMIQQGFLPKRWRP